MSTYGKAIEDTINEIDRLAKTISWLRDQADEKEKKYCNAAKGALNNAESYMQNLLDIVGPRYNMELS